MTQINITINPSAATLAKAYGNAGIASFLAKEVERVTFKIVRFAKQVTPVKTGRLRSSIGGGSFKGGSFPMGTGITTKGIEGRIVTNVNYAFWVHEGTKFMRGRPFMEQGAEFAKQNLAGEISGKLDKHLVARLTKFRKPI